MRRNNPQKKTRGEQHTDKSSFYLKKKIGLDPSIPRDSKSCEIRGCIIGDFIFSKEELQLESFLGIMIEKILPMSV